MNRLKHYLKWNVIIKKSSYSLIHGNMDEAKGYHAKCNKPRTESQLPLDWDRERLLM